MPRASNIILRPMRHEELSLLETWVAGEWSDEEGIDDLKIYYEAYPNSFFILEADGIAVGCTTIQRYSEQFAFLGLLRVIPEARGFGYGVDIWNKTLEMLRTCNAIQFFGVLHGGTIFREPLYRSSGFFPINYNRAYRMFAPSILEKSSRTLNILHCFFKGAPSVENTEEKIATYEHPITAVFGLPIRKEFIATFLNRNFENVILSLNDQGSIIGCAAIKRCMKHNTFKICPLYADNYEIAQGLIVELLKQIRPHINPDTVVSIDVVDSYQYKTRLIVDFNLIPNSDEDTAVMRKGDLFQPPELPDYKEKQITPWSYEFG